jgi:hypothetical protein
MCSLDTQCTLIICIFLKKYLTFDTVETLLILNGYFYNYPPTQLCTLTYIFYLLHIIEGLQSVDDTPGVHCKLNGFKARKW